MFRRGEILNETYEVLDEIGQGGSGIIYLAFHLRLQKKVIIKKIKDNYVGRVNERREADILKSLHHMYLPQVYDFVQLGSQVYTVIDYIDGNDLSYYINKKVHFEERQIILWMRQLCEALEYLHSQSPPIIHSDIKPSNIMITSKGNACLIDFNISFGQESGKRISGYSQRYASPEQLYKSKLYFSGGNYLAVHVDVRSDIYSLGATVYHLLTGISVSSYPEEPLGLAELSTSYSPQLIHIIAKAMQDKREDRYQSAAEMLGDIFHMKTRDADYRKLKFSRNLIYGICTFLFVIGAACTVVGAGERTEEAFIEKYDAIIETKDYEDDYNVLIDKCIDLLNDKKYTAVLGKNLKEKADLLYLIANCYFEEEDYKNAVSFYEKTIASDQSNPEYFRDYAIACARRGDVDTAESILAQAIERNMGEDHIYLVQAEIAFARGNMEEAVQNFDQAISLSNDSYLISRAYILCARVYREQGNVEKAAEVLTEATNVVDDLRLPSILRELELTCLKYIQGYPDADDTIDYIKKAIKCYKLLIEGDHATFSNYMNMAILYQYANDYETCKEILMQMEQLYPDDYRVYMRLALLEMVIQSTLLESNRDYQQTKSYYEQAVKRYNPTNGMSDESMQLLETKIQELYEKGWL